MPLTLIQGPAKEPIELAQAKHQVTQDLTITADDDKFTTVWIPAARERGEGATDRQFITATWEWQGWCFPACGILELPKPPLLTVVSVKYIDVAGDLQTWPSSNYTVMAPSGPKCRRGSITPVWGVTWPSTRCQAAAVRVRFTCGYGLSGADVPALLRQAMLLDIGSMFVHREQIVIDPASEVILELPDGSRSTYKTFKSRSRYPLPED